MKNMKLKLLKIFLKEKNITYLMICIVSKF